MNDDPTVVALVLAARDGDSRAWNMIVERYAPLVWGICHRYRIRPQVLSGIPRDDGVAV
jgi:DNA-directed RNA polymerase specialized sigma subunit